MGGRFVKLSRKLIAGLGVAALALPGAAVAHPSATDHPGHDNPGPPELPGAPDHPSADDHPGGGSATAHNPTVTYVFKGTYNDDGSVGVVRGNNHVRRADLVE